VVLAPALHTMHQQFFGPPRLSNKRSKSPQRAPHQLALGAYDADQERIEREALRRKSRDSRGWKKGVWTGARAGEPWGQRAIQPPAIPTTARELSDARVRGQAGA
jgi:hypothetical protein